jgi:hypothetical protein
MRNKKLESESSHGSNAGDSWNAENNSNAYRGSCHAEFRSISRLEVIDASFLSMTDRCF